MAAAPTTGGGTRCPGHLPGVLLHPAEQPPELAQAQHELAPGAGQLAADVEGEAALAVAAHRHRGAADALAGRYQVPHQPRLRRLRQEMSSGQLREIIGSL